MMFGLLLLVILLLQPSRWLRLPSVRVPCGSDVVLEDGCGSVGVRRLVPKW